MGINILKTISSTFLQNSQYSAIDFCQGLNNVIFSGRNDSFSTFKEMDKIKNNKTPTTGA